MHDSNDLNIVPNDYPAAKWPILLGVALALSLASALAIFWEPTKTVKPLDDNRKLPANEWLTYVNTAHSFSFNYPSDYIAQEIVDSTTGEPYVVFVAQNPSWQNPDVYIFAVNNPYQGNDSLEKYFDHLENDLLVEFLTGSGVASSSIETIPNGVIIKGEGGIEEARYEEGDEYGYDRIEIGGRKAFVFRRNIYGMAGEEHIDVYIDLRGKNNEQTKILKISAIRSEVVDKIISSFSYNPL